MYPMSITAYYFYFDPEAIESLVRRLGLIARWSAQWDLKRPAFDSNVIP